MLFAVLGACGGGDDVPDPCEGNDARVEIVARDIDVKDVVVDDSDLWVATAQGIVRASKSGNGKPATLGRQARHLAVDAHNLYWEEYGIYAMNKETLAIRQLASVRYGAAVVADGDIPSSIALGLPARTRESQFVYWIDDGVRRSSALGGIPETLGSGQQNILFVRVDDTRVYWTANHPATIHSRALAGGDERTLNLDGAANGFFIDPNAGFVVSDNGLSRFDKPNGAVSPIAPSPIESAATDGAAVYWAATTQCEIRAYDKATSSIRTIAAHQPSAASILIDDTHVYWVSPKDRTIRRAPK